MLIWKEAGHLPPSTSWLRVCWGAQQDRGSRGWRRWSRGSWCWPQWGTSAGCPHRRGPSTRCRRKQRSKHCSSMDGWIDWFHLEGNMYPITSANIDLFMQVLCYWNVWHLLKDFPSSQNDVFEALKKPSVLPLMFLWLATCPTCSDLLLADILGMTCAQCPV